MHLLTRHGDVIMNVLMQKLFSLCSRKALIVQMWLKAFREDMAELLSLKKFYDLSFIGIATSNSYSSILFLFLLECFKYGSVLS